MVLSPAQKLRPAVSPTPWTLDEVAGRLVEISGSTASAALTLTFSLVREAQRHGEPVGWVTLADSFFYPPDVARGGTDLSALVVVRLAKVESIARAGEKLLRSGGFGVVVLDLGAADIPMPLQTRLTGLAHRHHTRADLSDGKIRRGVFSRFAGFAARPCRKKTDGGQSLRLRFARAQGQTARPHLAL